MSLHRLATACFSILIAGVSLPVVAQYEEKKPAPSMDRQARLKQHEQRVRNIIEARRHFQKDLLMAESDMEYVLDPWRLKISDGVSFQDIQDFKGEVSKGAASQYVSHVHSVFVKTLKLDKDEVFAIYDNDGDGTLDLTEAGKAYNRYREIKAVENQKNVDSRPVIVDEKPPTATGSQVPEKAKDENPLKDDRDGDGVVSREERLRAHEESVRHIIQRNPSRKPISGNAPSESDPSQSGATEAEPVDVEAMRADFQKMMEAQYARGEQMKADAMKRANQQMKMADTMMENGLRQAASHIWNSPLEVVHTFGKGEAPGNIAISPDNRMFISVHQFYSPELKVAEVKEDGSLVPYPNVDWQRDFEEAGHDTLHGVLGLRCDQNGILWMLDRSPGPGEPGKLVAWDTNKEALHKVVKLNRPVIGEEPFLNDLAVDTKNQAIYIADTAAGHDSALISYNQIEGSMVRYFEGSVFTKPEDIDMVIDDRIITLGGNPSRIGINPITIDPQNEWVYFGAMSGTMIYRVKAESLKILYQSPVEEMLTHVEPYGTKKISDGITVDDEGNVYVTSITENAISVISPAFGKVSATHPLTGEPVKVYRSVPIYQREDLSWPDGMAVGPDGYIYATVNQLHRSPVLSGTGEDISTGKYQIVRFKTPFRTQSGR